MLGISLLSTSSAWPLRPEYFTLIKFLFGKNFVKYKLISIFYHSLKGLFGEIMYILIFSLIKISKLINTLTSSQRVFSFFFKVSFTIIFNSIISNCNRVIYSIYPKNDPNLDYLRITIRYHCNGILGNCP